MAKEKDLTSTKTGIVCSGPLVKSLVFDIKFELDETGLAVATIRELMFVNFEKGVINSSRGDYGDFSPTMALCLLSMNVPAGKSGKKNCIIAGMGNGSIYFWDKGKCVKALVGHTGSVSAICKRSDGNSFVSGDKTGKIIFWTDAFEKEKAIKLLETFSPSTMVVALSHGTKKQLLIGTKGGNVLLLNNGEGIDKAKSVMAGHSHGMLWAATLGGNFLYTGGEDQRLMKWEYKTTKKLVKEVKTPYIIRSIDLNIKQQLLAVGFYNGVIMLYKADTL
jgi:WD40 repeat protein